MAGFIACCANHQTSHTYGIMHLYKYHYYTHSTTFYYHSSTLVLFLLFHLLYEPISADLRYVDLILENIEDTRTHPTLPSQLKNISTGTALLPVPTFFVEKIESGAFIEMGDLIPTRLGLYDMARLKLRCSVTNISEWLQAFTVYVSVIAKKQPYCVPNLMGYQILILEASNNYCNECWLGYDRHFWQ